MYPELTSWSMIEPFGLFLALGLGLGCALSARLAARAGLGRREGAAALGLGLILALPFSRLFYLLGSWESGPWAAWLAFGRGGLSGYGALLGAALGAGIALRQAEGRRLAWFDVAAPGVIATALVARLGCYVAGCDFGRPLAANAPRWLARLGTFPESSAASPSPVWAAHVARFGDAVSAPWTRPLHPTQLYEAAGLGALLAVLFALRRRQRRSGAVFAAALFGYGALRLASEAFRDDADRGVYTPLTLNQACALVSMLALAAALALQLARSRRSI
jgi:phosphatidylglycerol---prolipoprotein diacylglyceryl transferase